MSETLRSLERQRESIVSIQRPRLFRFTFGMLSLFLPEFHTAFCLSMADFSIRGDRQILWHRHCSPEFEQRNDLRISGGNKEIFAVKTACFDALRRIQ